MIFTALMSVVLAVQPAPLPDPTFTEASIQVHAHAILVWQQAEREAKAEAHRLWHVEQDRIAAEKAAQARSQARAAAQAAARAPKPVAAPQAAPAPAPSTGGMPAILIRIRGCESGHNYNAKNPRSTASGAYQFLDSTWRSTTGLPAPARAHSAAVQDQAAITLYNRAGTTPWNASRGCWG